MQLGQKVKERELLQWAGHVGRMEGQETFASFIENNYWKTTHRKTEVKTGG
jgi:hypothetical protein